jgi:hypothetical protein
VAQPLLLESLRSCRRISAWAHGRTHRTALHSAPRHASSLHSTITKLLCPAPHLGLKTEKLCTLHGLEEFRELTLLTLLKIESLSLDLHCLVEKLRDTILIRIVAGENLLAKLAPCFALAPNEIHSLFLEARVRLLKLLHLVVGELKAALHDIGSPLTQPLLEHRAARIDTVTSNRTLSADHADWCD